MWFFTMKLVQNSGLAAASSGFHVVLGNEACDVDSMVCSLAYAYFLSKVRLSQSPGTYWEHLFGTLTLLPLSLSLLRALHPFLPLVLPVGTE